MEERAFLILNNIKKKAQLEAVREDGLTIQYIDNPSEQVKLEAVKQNGRAIEYIKNPSEEIQLEAIRQNRYNIEYIDNPSEEVQLIAVRGDGYVIRLIKNPSSYIKSIVDVIETSHRTVYVLHEPDKEPTFSIGCQCNITKDYFIKRIYNLDGGLEKKST